MERREGKRRGGEREEPRVAKGVVLRKHLQIQRTCLSMYEKQIANIKLQEKKQIIEEMRSERRKGEMSLTP